MSELSLSSLISKSIIGTVYRNNSRLYFRDLAQLKLYMETGNNIYTTNKFFGKYLLNNIPSIDKSNNFLRIEKRHNDGLFGTTIFGATRPVASIDIVEKVNIVDIPYVSFNDIHFAVDRNYMYGEPVNNTEARILKDTLFNYATKIAISKGIKQIRCDVHNNLKKYETDIKPYGFELTKERAEDNPYWFKTYKTIN